MRLIVVDDSGTLVDGTDVTREELVAAQCNPLAALALLDEMNLGGLFIPKEA